MGKRIFKKCLSIALSSSLIFSPAFAMDEQFVSYENCVTATEKGKTSYIERIFNKESVHLALVVSGAVLFGILNAMRETAYQNERDMERREEVRANIDFIMNELDRIIGKYLARSTGRN